VKKPRSENVKKNYYKNHHDDDHQVTNKGDGDHGWTIGTADPTPNSKDADFYKDFEEIADANAFSGLSILLQGDVVTWWMEVKSTITTWENAKKAIRDEFTPRPPAHRIYQMIFETK
jgi:hypothetical protein